MSAAYYDIGTQECHHFHPNDGDGVNPSFEKVYEFADGRNDGARETILFIYIRIAGKSVTNFATSYEGRRYLSIMLYTVRSSLTQRAAYERRRAMISSITLREVRPRSSATNARSCSAGWIAIRRPRGAD